MKKRIIFLNRIRTSHTFLQWNVSFLRNFTFVKGLEAMSIVSTLSRVLYVPPISVDNFRKHFLVSCHFPTTLWYTCHYYFACEETELQRSYKWQLAKLSLAEHCFPLTTLSRKQDDLSCLCNVLPFVLFFSFHCTFASGSGLYEVSLPRFLGENSPRICLHISGF